MVSIVQKLTEQKLINPPKFVSQNVAYETITGSMSYGVSTDSSDMDIYGFCFPDKELIFPHLTGEIQGFGHQIQRFEQFQQHHIMSLDGQHEYDITIYNIVKFFQLCMENNPNMVDSLYTPERCILHSTNASKLVRANRDIFLHKGSWHKFKGYGYSQISKIKNKTNRSNPKRAASIAEFGYDVKFAYHVVRLIDEVEQILMTGTLDLEQNREQLKSIRRGEWTFEQIEAYFAEKEKTLGQLYIDSKLPNTPQESKIKSLLMTCLEEHYGSLDALIVRDNQTAELIAELNHVMGKYK